MDDGDFAELLRRAKGGEDASIRILLERFEKDVRLMVRLRLPRSLRAEFDSMDFVQSVWKSVFASPEPGRPDEVGSDPSRFRGYLAGIARNQIYQAHRRRTRTHKYDLSREESLYVRRGSRDVPREIACPDPTPSQTVGAEDQLASALSGRPDIVARVVQMRRDGMTLAEIAEVTGRNERTIRRVLDSIREQLEGAG